VTSAARYKILEKIGSGSFATVYRARDLELGREVAIKQLHDEFVQDPGRLDRYWQEAQLLASLQHPNIVTIFDIVRERGWLVMELMQGNLADKLQGKQMDLRALRSLLAQVLRALKYLHGQGIIHGDVKPGNFMLDPRRRVKLGDFGLARRASNEQGSLLKGTTKYMAPEMVSEDFGDVGPASDLYSLGFAAYDLMCGPNFDNLFPGLNAFGRNRQIAWMMWHAAGDRKLPEISRVLKDVPDDIARVVQKLTQKDQAFRYKSADEALSDLQVDLKLIGGTEEQPVAETSPPMDRKPVLIAGGALAVSTVLSLAMLFWPSGNAGNRPAERTTRGIVRSVGASAIVLDDMESAVPTEYQVAPTPRIFLQNDQKNILLRELKPGDFVDLVTARDNSQLALSLTVDRPVDSRGALKSIDLSASRLVIALEEGNLRDDLPLRVPASAKITLNGAVIKLNELQPGDAVTARHLSEPGARKGRLLHELSARRNVTEIGYVLAFDAASRELVIEEGRGGITARQKRIVAENCAVTINNQAATITDLKAGDRVSLRHDLEIHVIAATRQQQVDGVIDSVAEDGRSLTIVAADGKRHPLAVDDSCEVTLSLERIPAIDLRRFDEVRASIIQSGDAAAATILDARRPAQRDRYAVVIGTQAYADSVLSPLKTANEDARLIHRALLQRGAFAEERCHLLIDADKVSWQKQISETLQAATKPMQVIVSISGHAYLGDDDKVYLAAKDFQFARMAETGIPLDWLAEQLNACAAEEKLLLLDISPPGSGRDLGRQLAGADILAKLTVPLTSTAVLLPCVAGQQSHPLADRPQSRFAWTVTQGLRGSADANRDLRITAGELFDWIERELPKQSSRAPDPQTPLLIMPK